MIRVLMIGMHDKIGGVETFLMNYYRNIDRSKVQFDFINMFDKLCFQDEIIELGGKIYQVPNVKRNPLGYYKKIKGIIQKNSYEIIHINMLSMANVLPILAAKKAGAKHIIVHSHNTNIPNGMIRKILDKINKKIVLKNTTDLFACSKVAGIWMFGKNKEFKVINNAVDIKKFEFDEEKRKKMRKQLKIENKFVIGHVGRFCEQKNHEFLIEIFRKISQERQDAVLLLIGEGELKNKIKDKVKKYNLQKKVIFLDPVSNVNDYFQAMDVFLLPSKFEGLPVVGVEAETSGLMVVTSNNVSRELPIRELSKYCSLENIEEWCSILKDDMPERKDRTIEIIEANYSIKEETKKIEKMYELMIK